MLVPVHRVADCTCTTLRLSEGKLHNQLVCPIFCTSFIVSVARLSLLIDSRSRGWEKWEARSGFHFSIPQALCQPGLRRRWPVTQRRVWPDGIVVDSPPLRQHPDLLHRVEDFTVQELVPQLRVEAFAVAVLPGASWLVQLAADKYMATLHHGRISQTRAGSCCGPDAHVGRMEQRGQGVHPSQLRCNLLRNYFDALIVGISVTL